VPVIRLDECDAIAFASERWVDFIRETGGSALSTTGVLGRPFSDFAPDAQLAPLYRLVFRRVRELQQEMRVPFRIAALDRRWHVSMHVSPLASGEIECRYHVLHLEVPGGELLTQCAWCLKVHFPEGVWAEVADLSGRLDLFLSDAPRVTHGICPSCAVAFRASAKLAP
jgi:hypothetical protein